LAQTVTIVVYPSGADADALTVSDAMRQVLDAFELLSRAEARREGGDQIIVWKLERASTNSPFTVEGSAIPADPSMPVDNLASIVKHSYIDGIEKLIRGEERASWINDDAEKIARRLFARNMNGIGRTDISVSNERRPLIINHRLAFQATRYLDKLATERAAEVEDLTRTEHGSLEGNVISLTTHYGKPAFMLRTRLAGEEVKCVLTDDAAEAVGDERNWREVWKADRVLVTGAIWFDEHGKVVKVNADYVTPIKSRSLSAREIQSYKVLESVYNSARSGQADLWTSTLSFVEVFRLKEEEHAPKPYPEGNLDIIEEAFRQEFVKLVPVDMEIGMMARRLRREHKGLSKLGDAIHLASALRWSVDCLMTFDSDDLLHLDKKIRDKSGKFLQIRPPADFLSGPLFAPPQRQLPPAPPGSG
jgi:predicted nucleic acid-binding protein